MVVCFIKINNITQQVPTPNFYKEEKTVTYYHFDCFNSLNNWNNNKLTKFKGAPKKNLVWSQLPTKLLLNPQLLYSY